MIPRVNYPILVCLVALGLALVVCTVIIGQRTYNLLRPLVSDEDRSPRFWPLLIAIPPAEPRVTTNAQVIAPAIVHDLSTEAQPPDKPQIARHSGMEQRTPPAQVHRLHKEYTLHLSRQQFLTSRGPALW